VHTLVGTRAYAPFDVLVERFSAGEVRLAAAGLTGGSLPLVLAELLRRTDKPTLILAADRRSADRLRNDLAFFLREADGGHSPRLLPYPAYDIAPFESISPHPAILAERAACLEALARKQAPLIVAPVEAVMNRIMPREIFQLGRQTVKVGEWIDRDVLLGDLLDLGYRLSPLVEEVGEVSVRGNILDVLPPGVDDPVRLEMFGDEVESVRLFDAAKQVTRKHVDSINLYPCSDVHLGKANAEQFAARLKALAEEQDVPKPRRERLIEEVANRIAFPGTEFFTPLLHDELETLLAHLGAGTVVLVDPAAIEGAVDKFAEKVALRHERAREAGKLCVEPSSLYLDADGLRTALEPLRQLAVGHEAYLEGVEPIVFETFGHGGLREEILARASDAHMLAPLVERLSMWLAGEGRALLVARSLGAADRLERLLTGYELPVTIHTDRSFRNALSGGQGLTRVPILIGDLSAGFVLPGLELAVVCEEEIFGERRRAEAAAKRKTEMLSAFADLDEGDFVVHLKHGVGIYRGLQQMQFGDKPGEYLHLEYASGDKLYVPVDRLNAVQRYVGAGAAPRIDRLGGSTWEKVQTSARKAARQMAKELLKLYAARAAKPGFSFPPPDEIFREFEATFPFEETPDQTRAIADALRDMLAPHPADRLICGDVGFGKTEVAMRAAFLAVLGGKQVAVLVPTTTLAFQHYMSFAERMAPFGVKVEMLSRFVQPRKRKEVIERLGRGEVAVIVGPHALLSKKIQYADLGLLLVDEEQHFGVGQKEKIKQLATDVDVLTFTATPIPRTLHMSMAGIRDLSVINTPPEDRRAIRTFVTRWDEDTIREALEREMQRGGQSFFIHNRVKTIDNVADRIRRLMPRARIAVGHGQMDEKKLEKLMIDFARHQFDILVCTTIVESGLDFPAANTMIIDRADALGLSQLYQLRGRVGRSKRQAYCYLLVPPSGAVTPESRKRLAVLRTFTDLGSGFKIAARDLEIRGAGNLLGAEQSGQIGAVGLEMYTKLLDEEVRRLKGEEVIETFACEVVVHVPAYLPETYVDDVHVRLNLYKRSADAHDDQALAELLSELTDRFGRPPAAVHNLLRVVGLRRRAETLRIKRVEAGFDRIAFEFDDATPVTPGRMVMLIAAQPGRFSLSPDGKLYEKISKQNGPESVFSALEEGLQRLADCVT